MFMHEPLLRVLGKGYRLFRLRRVVEAATLAAAVILPALLVALVLGWILGGSRIGAWLVPIVAACGVVVGLYRAVLFGVRQHLSFGAFLLKIEAAAGLGRNELVNALQLGRRAPEMDDPLAREIASEVLRAGTETASRIRFRSLAPSRRLRGPGIQAGAAVVAILLIGILAPSVILRTAGQIAHPGRIVSAPGLRIVVEPGDCVVDRGSSVAIRAVLVGLSGEPVVFHRAGDGAWQRETMQVEAGGYGATLADLQAPTEYAVAVSGNRSRTYRIDLEEPLRATGYEKHTRFPAYTGLAPERELSPHASIAALTGSEVDLLVHMSRPDATGRLVFDSGGTIPLAPADESVSRATVVVRRPEVFRVQLESKGVHGGRWESEPFRVDPIPDRSPSLYLLAPAEQIDLPPDMKVPLEVDCADDFGITKLDLVWHRNETAVSRRTIARWTKEREARVSYPWDLEDVAMSPGDRITYHLELSDNDAVSGPKTTISPDYLIRFPTVEQMYTQQTEDRKEGIEDLRESLEKQVQLRQELNKITQDIRQEHGMQWEQKQEVEEFLKQQDQVLQKMEDISSGMDRQIQRMQQGQLFSPEMVAKIAKIQELTREIQNPQFHEMLQKLQQAMQSLDPEAVRKALEQMKLSQKQLELGLDRTVQMLERLLAEEKLDEAIQRADRLKEKQDQINQDLTQSKNGQRADSTSALTPQQAAELAQRQADARKELEELRKAMQELQDLAAKSHPQMEKQLEGNRGQSAKKSLQDTEEQMNSGQQCMGRSSRPNALRAGRRSSKDLSSFSQEMRQMQSELEASQTADISRKLLGLAQDMVALSEQQETVVGEVNRENTRDLAVEQDRISRATGAVVDQLYDLSRQTPFITSEQARALGDVVNSLAAATDSYEDGQRQPAGALGKRAQTMMDAVVASLLQSNQSMCQSASSSACSKPNPFGKMQGLTTQQSGVNDGSQQLFQEMQSAGRLQQSGQARLEQLAAQQEQIRQGLSDLSQSMGQQQDVLGRLDDLAKEMQDAEKQMRERNLDERLLQRQQKILSRLLTAQRSLRRQDYEEQRRSRPGVDQANPVSPPQVEAGLSQREQLRRGILKGEQDPIPGDFRRIVDAYFRALMGEER